MIADILWVFPGMREERVEEMTIDDLLGWHQRASVRKRADQQAIQAALASVVATLRGGR